MKRAMFPNRPRLVLFCAVVGFLLGPAGAARAQQLSAESFRQDALFSRFDKDADGQLSEQEKSNLRNAFGGIDVPMMPIQPYDYTDVRLPAHVEPSEFKRADNTPEEN